MKFSTGLLAGFILGVLAGYLFGAPQTAEALHAVLGGPGVAPRRTLSVAYPLSDSKQEKTA